MKDVVNISRFSGYFFRYNFYFFGKYAISYIFAVLFLPAPIAQPVRASDS